MDYPFQRTSSGWVRYSEYECKKAKDGLLYVTPAPRAKPSVYNPVKDPETLVVDMLNVGMLSFHHAKEEEIRAAILEFAGKYGLLGFMTALPTTPQSIVYDAVYLPTNHFIREESLSTEEYLEYFFPFEKLDFTKNGKESVWNINLDRTMMALAMTFDDQPQAMNMSIQREYAERYDWLVTQFKDWVFTLVSSFLYYEDYDKVDEDTRNLYRKGMAAFEGISPTYHIALLDKPTIIWDFHSLLLGAQMMFNFMLVDEKHPLRLCKHCQKVFIAGHPNAAFCSPRCKNQYNVYKSRAKKKE